MTRSPCLVCGKTYRGSLDRHLNTVMLVDVSGLKLTRCDWNLNVARIKAIPETMRAAGWEMPGPFGVTAAARVNDQRIAVKAGSGAYPSSPNAHAFNPDMYEKVWWVRRWAVPVARCSRWQVNLRVQYIRELLELPHLWDALEVAERLGGWQAVAELNMLPARCLARSPEPEVITAAKPRGLMQPPYDWCILPVNHGGPHLGCRLNQRMFIDGCWVS